jgi:phospho-N-acetylmuramoyl-pentapeptide-transferase
MLYWLLDAAHDPLRDISDRTTFAVLTALIFVLWGVTASRLTHRMGRPVGPNISVSRAIAMIDAAATGNLLPLSAIFIATLVWMNPFNLYVWIVLGTAVGFGLLGFYQDRQSAIAHSASGRMPFLVEAMIGLAASIVLLIVAWEPLAPSLFWLILPLSSAVLVGAACTVNLIMAFRWPTIIAVMIASASVCGLAYTAGNVVLAQAAGIHYAAGVGELAVVSGALLGTGLGGSLATIAHALVAYGGAPGGPMTNGSESK